MDLLIGLDEQNQIYTMLVTVRAPNIHIYLSSVTTVFAFLLSSLKSSLLGIIYIK